jgi:hypothetical protein
MKNRILVIAFIMAMCSSYAQTTWQNNNPGANSPLGYLGWNDPNNTTLRVRQNNRVRMWLRDTTYAHVNWGNLNNVTRMAIHQNTSTTGIPFTYTSFQPASMLHIGDVIPGPLVRSWMNIGTTYGNAHDGMYVGMYDVPDAVYGSGTRKADAVVAWGCNSIGGLYGPDNLRFIFMAATNGSDGTGPEMDDEGKEVARFSPAGNYGIGNFYTNGLNEHPTQRLDVDGTARLRQMPTNEEFDVVITGKYAESPGVNGDYVLNYSTIADFTDALDIPCDWNVVGGGNHVAMGYTGACAPGKVLVGLNAAPLGNTTKVILTKSYAGTTLSSEATVGGGASEIAADFSARNATDNRGIKTTATTAGNRNYGVDARAVRAGIENFGVKGHAEDARNNFGLKGTANIASVNNFGVHGQVRGESPSINNVGVYGFADGPSINYNFGGYFKACGSAKHIGVYAEVCDTTGNAGYFVGNIVSTQPAISLSDETIKTNINEIEGAMQIIEQLEPVNYSFNTEAYPHLNLSTSLNYGFRAQQVQEVLPSIVKQIVHPAQNDSLGNEISPEENLLGIEYQQLIPILTAGMKAQQAQIEAQDESIAQLQESLNNQNEALANMMDQLAAMQQQLNQCCQGNGSTPSPKSNEHGFDFNSGPNNDGGNELYQNIPNPFRESTTISYQLEFGGRVQLSIYDGNGKVVTTLVEANQPNGRHSAVWNANGMPAGVYHYALYVNGKLLVKRAIKLQE